MPAADARVGAPAAAPAVEFTPRTKPAIRPTATARATAPVFMCRGIFCIPASSPDLADNSKLGFGNRTTRRTSRNGSGAPDCTLVPYSFEPTRTNGSGRTQPGPGTRPATAASRAKATSWRGQHTAGDAGGPAEPPPGSTRRASSIPKQEVTHRNRNRTGAPIAHHRVVRHRETADEPVAPDPDRPRPRTPTRARNRHITGFPLICDVC